MRKILATISLLTLFIPTLVGATTLQYCGTTTGARGVWWFDESSGDATDQTSNGYTLTNTNTVGYASGDYNNWADFGTANTNKYFVITDNLTWSKTTASTTISWHGKIRTNVADGGYTLAQLSSGTNGNGMEIRYSDEVGSGTGRRIRFLSGSVSTFYSVDLGTVNSHTIELARNGGTEKVIDLYLDNVLVATGVDSGTDGGGGLNASFNTGILQDAGGSYVSFPASVYEDETFVTFATWGAAQVAAVYNRTNPPINCPAAVVAPTFNPHRKAQIID